MASIGFIKFDGERLQWAQIGHFLAPLAMAAFHHFRALPGRSREMAASAPSAALPFSNETGLAALSTPFATTPRALVEAASTAEERLAAYEVAAALLLKRSLRNGAASSIDSIKHRSLSDQLMPAAQWLKHKGSFARSQALPKTLEGLRGDNYDGRLSGDYDGR